MSQLIAHAILACLRTLLELLLPASGKRRATPQPAAPTPAEPYVSPWARPWTSPSKAEAAAFFRAQAERDLQHERRQAAAYASLGVDYPYTYDGAPFGADDFPKPQPRMSREALTTDYAPFEADCWHCGRWTTAPVECHHLGETPLHACPDCLFLAHNSPSPQQRSA